MSDNSNYIKGRCLEISEDTYCRKFGKGITKQDILHFTLDNENATIIGDLTMMSTLTQGVIDCFVCTQTVNFIYDVKSALRGARYLLKKNGTLLATVSGISQISRYDMERWGDYWRFTDKSLKMLVEEAVFRDVQVSIYGNALAATAFVQGCAQQDLPNIHLLDECDEDYQVTLGLIAKK